MKFPRKFPLTHKGRITYDYEKEDEEQDVIRYWKFLIDYRVWAGEPMVMYQPDGSGYPGSPPACEIQSIKCLEIDDNKSLTEIEEKAASKWFQNLIDSDYKIFDMICEECFEDASDDNRY